MISSFPPESLLAHKRKLSRQLRTPNLETEMMSKQVETRIVRNRRRDEMQGVAVQF